MEEIFTKYIEENEGIIYKVIGLYADYKEDKKDLHQEILYQAWRSFKNFRSDSKFGTWLYKVALNTALTFRKKADRKSEIPKSPDVESQPNENYELLILK